MSAAHRGADAALSGAPFAASAGATPGLLHSLADAEMDTFIGFTARRRYPADAPIIVAGQSERALYVVASGVVRLDNEASGEALLRGDGEVFGLLNFLDGAASQVAATAVTEVELLRLDGDGLARLIAWQPRIAGLLLRDLGATVAARLRRLQPGD